MTLRFLATLPAKLAHEFTHVVVGAPWIEDWRIVIRRDAAAADVIWNDDAPQWGVIIGHLAPFIAGSALGIGVAVYAFLTGFRMPSTVLEWGQVSILILLWVSYTAPSKDDRDWGGRGE